MDIAFNPIRAHPPGLQKGRKRIFRRMAGRPAVRLNFKLHTIVPFVFYFDFTYGQPPFD